MNGVSKDINKPPIWLRHRFVLLPLAVSVIVGITLGSAYAVLDRTFDLPISATVTVSVASELEAADVNDDGKVDGADLVIVTRNVGPDRPTDPRADVDNNGVVDVYDLTFVARHFGFAVSPG